MATEQGTGGSGSTRGLGAIAEKIVRLHRVLHQQEIPHAFGGAVAVDYYRVPRATIDIDLNIFVPPEDHARVIAALTEEFQIEERDALVRELGERGQGMVRWGETRIDLFFSTFDFHESMAGRSRMVEFGDASIPILSAEDILVIKAIFDRSQDWADIEAVCKLQGGDLDLEYMSRWLNEIVGSADPRARRLVEMVQSH